MTPEELALIRARADAARTEATRISVAYGNYELPTARDMLDLGADLDDFARDVLALLAEIERLHRMNEAAAQALGRVLRTRAERDALQVRLDAVLAQCEHPTVMCSRTNDVATELCHVRGCAVGQLDPADVRAAASGETP